MSTVPAILKAYLKLPTKGKKVIRTEENAGVIDIENGDAIVFIESHNPSFIDLTKVLPLVLVL